MEDNFSNKQPTFVWHMEEDLNILSNERQPQLYDWKPISDF